MAPLLTPITLGCRVRLLGNAMSRPPLHFDLRRKRAAPAAGPLFEGVSVNGPHAHSGGLLGSCKPSFGELWPPNKTTRVKSAIYPVHHELETTMLLVEVRVMPFQVIPSV